MNGGGIDLAGRQNRRNGLNGATKTDMGIDDSVHGMKRTAVQ